MCQLCREGSESIFHVLQDCHVARNLWNSLFPPMAASIFFGLKTSEGLDRIAATLKHLLFLISNGVSYFLLAFGHYVLIGMVWCLDRRMGSEI